MTNDDLCFMSAFELAEQFRAGALSPCEVVDACLERIVAVDPVLHAFVTVCAERARVAARAAERELRDGRIRGPLHGIPYTVKDLLFTAGVRTTGGSRIFESHIPDRDAIAVERLERGGAILIGKTSTPEFGFKSTTESSVSGITRNPWDLGRTAGGSSGGAGAAVAAGLAPVALGTDAGGSIRTPASFCGVAGFKPTFGVVPHGPGFGGGASIAHSGPLSRTVTDAALMLQVIAGPDERDRYATLSLPGGRDLAQLGAAGLAGMRVGWSRDLGYAAVDPDVARACEAALEVFAGLGAHTFVLDALFPDPQDAFNVIIRAENHVFAAPLLEHHGDLLDPGMAAFTRNGAAITAAAYLEAGEVRSRLCQALAAVFARCDVLVTPTLATPAFTIDERPQTIAGRPVAGMDWLAFTYPFNLTGNPAISIPCGFTPAGLPIGLQIVGPRGADWRVLEVAAAFERASPWCGIRPPIG